MKIIQILECQKWLDENGKSMLLGLDDGGKLYALLITGKTHMGRTAYKWIPLSVEAFVNE